MDRTRYEGPPQQSSLRIAMIVPPWYELPPSGYGGVEQVCTALVDALTARGHEVTIFGAGTGTGAAAHFVGTVDQIQYRRLGQSMPELAHLARVNRSLDRGGFDIAHDHTNLGPLIAGRRRVPTIATVHNSPTGELGEIMTQVDPAVGLVAISAMQRRLAPDLPWVATIHHGIEMPPDSSDQAGPDAAAASIDPPVLWLARFTADKGPDLAIRACRAAGLPLVLAGKCNEPAEHRYLTEVIEPMLGPDVRVVRNPDRESCLQLLRSARCLIMPVRWHEPFGMVMVEAMATGTPVVALNRGAVPEIVHRGTGVIVDDPDELPRALHEVAEVDPAACLAHVRGKFSADRMAREYERLYRYWAQAHRPVPVRPGLASATPR